jgi:dTDP-4-dehydrorhamnose reductase
MKILLLGKGGQVGWELQRSLAPLGDVVALDARSEALCGDLTRLEALAATVAQVRPDVIVNAAAYTAVDRAESEPERARTVNALAPGVLARAAARHGAWLVHYSTDYVFDGSGQQPWRESDPTGPLNVYGRTKLEGETRIVDSGARHLILRTSWVHSARGGNFVRTMLRLAQEREQLSVVDDQVGAPTGADLLADVTAHLIARVGRSEPAGGLSGTYHVAAAGEATWNSYAKHILSSVKRSFPAIKIIANDVLAVPSSHFPTPARRPLNSRLDTRRLCQTFRLQLPHWQQGVDRLLAEIL